MNQTQLYNKAEFKCKPLGCAMVRCQSEGRSTEECNKCMRELQECIKVEKEKLIQKYNLTGSF